MYLQKLGNLKELSLEDNQIKSLPENLDLILPNVETLNMNGNVFDDQTFLRVIIQVNKMRSLQSLYINLYAEDQVDMVMRHLQDLKFLNGLPVERDILEETPEASPEKYKISDIETTDFNQISTKSIEQSTFVRDGSKEETPPDEGDHQSSM